MRRLLLRPGSIDDHASSALGLAGGCDVRVVDGVVELRPPAGMDASAAQRILARAQLGDGIAEIGADGTVSFTDPSAAAMRDILGYDCPVLRPQDARERATELRDRLSPMTLDCDAGK